MDRGVYINIRRPESRGSRKSAIDAWKSCSDQDNRGYNKTLTDVRPLVEDLDAQSILGGDWLTGMLPCTGWSIKATENFSGLFQGDTTTPMLFVSNTYDPVAPLEKYATYTLEWSAFHTV